MTVGEAEVKLSYLRDTLRVIAQDNIKGVFLNDLDGNRFYASVGELDDISVLSKNQDEFDNGKVSKVEVFGYLPNTSDIRKFSLGDEEQENEVKVMRKLFIRAISSFLRMHFGLELTDSAPKQDHLEWMSFDVKAFRKV